MSQQKVSISLFQGIFQLGNRRPLLKVRHCRLDYLPHLRLQLGKLAELPRHRPGIEPLFSDPSGVANRRGGVQREFSGQDGPVAVLPDFQLAVKDWVIHYANFRSTRS